VRNLAKYQLVLFVLLLILWSAFTPIFEGADEEGHFCAVDFLAHNNKLPDVRDVGGCFIWHPPLYYFLLSPITKSFQTSEYKSTQVKINPKADLLRKGEFAQYVHDKRELFFEWNNLELLVHTLRLVTAAIAVLIFIIIAKTSASVFKNKNERNLSLLLLFNPMFIHIFTTITNVTLVSLISTVVIAIDIFHSNEIKSNKLVFAQGLLVGLGFITKISALALVPALLVILVLEYKKNKTGLLNLLTKILFFSLGFFATALWYIIRNLQLYGEVIEANVIAKTYGASHHFLLLEEVGPLNYVNSIVLSLFKTFWSAYGALTIKFPEFVNVMLLIISMLVIYTIAVNFKKIQFKLKISLIYTISILATLVIMNIQLAAMHAKDLFPAYLPLSLLFGYGLYSLRDTLKSRSPRIFLVAITILGTYILAQKSIIDLIKEVIQKLANYSHQQTSLNILGTQFFDILIKFLLVLVLTILTLKLFKRARFNQKSILFTTNAIAVIDVLVLFISTYLFYKNFI